MRRRWPALAATIPLVLGLAAATARPASATAGGQGGAVQPGGPVSPGDQFSGSVTYTAPSAFKLVLKDLTKGWTQTVDATLANAALSSAEAVAEAPCCTADGGNLPLTNFGTASFTAASANGKSLATFGPADIVMPGTSVSAMDGTGKFSVSSGSYTGAPWWFGF